MYSCVCVHVCGMCTILYITYSHDFLHYRSREVVKPKPAEPPKNPPPKTNSPVEEAKAPPGFERKPQPPNTANELTAITTLSNTIVHNTFDPYGGATITSETLNPPPGIPSAPVNSSSTERVAFANPPPGFASKNVQQAQQKENEWPDLTETQTTETSLFPLGIPTQPVMGNIASAVMNASKHPSNLFVTSVSANSTSSSSINLRSESSFPSLGAMPVSTSALSVQSEASFPSLSNQPMSTSSELVARTLVPPHAQQSKLLKFAVAATTSDNTSWSSGGSAPSTYQVAVQSGRSIDLSSQNFPPMVGTASDVTSGGSVPKTTNQNDRVASGKRSPTSEKKSKQSQVIEKVRKALGYSKEEFTRFKTLMGWYKNGEITVQEFKAQCVVLFGSKWREIGPEVAEVMPDQEKKNELLSSFGIRSETGKSMKSQKRAPVSTPSVWGTGPAVPVHNYNRMYTGVSSEDYPTLSSAANQPKVLPQPTPWNVVIQ